MSKSQQNRNKELALDNAALRSRLMCKNDEITRLRNAISDALDALQSEFSGVPDVVRILARALQPEDKK